MIRRTIVAVLFACAVSACADSPVAPSRGQLTPGAPSLAVVANNHETFGPLVATNPCGPTPEGVSYTGKRHTVIKETGPFTMEVTQNWSRVFEYDRAPSSHHLSGQRRQLRPRCRGDDLVPAAGYDHQRDPLGVYRLAKRATREPYPPGTTAVASISTFARGSKRVCTTTTVIAGYCRPMMSR